MANTYLNKTMGSASTNSKKWTFSTWFRLGAFNRGQALFSAGDTSTYTNIQVNSNNYFQVYSTNSMGGSGATDIETRMKILDTSAWYHCVVQFDSTQSTQADRLKIYINGQEQTNLITNTNNIALNQDNDKIGANGVPHYIGTYVANSNYFGGTLSQTAFVDGSVVAATNFGETDTSGIWKVKSAGATWGNNGFLLTYESAGASAAVSNFGEDKSGNGNHFASNNLPTNPNTQHTPENLFAQWDKPSQLGGSITNNGIQETTQDNAGVVASLAMPKGSTSKWWIEMKCIAGNNNAIGICPANQTFRLKASTGINNYSITLYGADGRVFSFGSTPQGADGGRQFGAGDILNFKIDMNGGTIEFFKSGSSIGSAEGWNNTSYPLMCILSRKGGSSQTMSLNTGCPDYSITSNSGNGYADAAGYGKFQYQPPSGYYALCTKNIAAYGG